MLLWKPSTFKSPRCPFQGKGRSLHTGCPTVSALAISLHRKRQRTRKVTDKFLTTNELRQPGRRGPVFFFGRLGEGGVLEFLDYCCSQCVPQFSIYSPISQYVSEHVPNRTSLHPCDVTMLDAAN